MAVGGTDSELQGLASADVDLGSGYRLESCRVGAAWAVVPNDVIAMTSWRSGIDSRRPAG